MCGTSANFQEMNWKRSDIVVTTKIFWGGHGENDVGLSRKHIVEGMNVMNIFNPLCFRLIDVKKS